MEGRIYTIDLRGSPTDDGTLGDPLPVRHPRCRRQPDCEHDKRRRGDGLNSKVTFTATASDTFYNAAGACKSNLGTCEAQVTDNTPDHCVNG